MARIEAEIVCVRVDISKDGTAVVSDILANGQFSAVGTLGSTVSQVDAAVVRARDLGVSFEKFDHALNEEVFNAKSAEADHPSYFALERISRRF